MGTRDIHLVNEDDDDEDVEDEDVYIYPTNMHPDERDAYRSAVRASKASKWELEVGEEEDNQLFQWVRPIHLDDEVGNPDPRIAAHARKFGVNIDSTSVGHSSRPSATDTSTSGYDGSRDGTNDEGDNAGEDIYERQHSQYLISQFTCENDFTHYTQDEDHGSRRASPGIGAIGKPYGERERTMEPYNEELLSWSFESMSIGTQFSDSSNEANVYPPHVMSYGQPSSSTDEEYGMSRCFLSKQMSYQVPYQMKGGFGINTWVNFEYPIHVEAMGRTQEIYAWHVRIFNQYYRGSLSCINIVSNNKMGFLHLSIPLNHIDPHFGTKGTLQCNVYKLLIFN
ncbi:hypothetical protein CK203_013319 [Vitis vinifera]|uniref:Uncharacterized protein n=1 Tax=Vitis vinifera TaxID=29760 RepID=A0A438JQ56_VITVI|nr:hypothetical protein CK203_013319 [Vitis vinifera]